MFMRSQISGSNQLKMFDNIAIPNPVTHFTHWEAFLPLGLLQIMNVLLIFHLKYKQFDLKIVWNYYCALELCLLLLLLSWRFWRETRGQMDWEEVHVLKESVEMLVHELQNQYPYRKYRVQE